MEPRNFVSVVPAAKKGKLGPIFFLNIRVMYILSVKKQRTGQKTGKNPPKKVVFSSLSDQLAEFEQKRTLSFSEYSEKGRSFSIQTQPADRKGWKKKQPFLESFCLFFVLFFAFLPTVCIYETNI